MKLTTAILVIGMAAGTALGQNLDNIQNTRDTMKALQQKQANDSNAALDAMQAPAQKAATSHPSANRKVKSAPAPRIAVSQEPFAKAKAKAKVAAHRSRSPQENVAVENNPNAEGDNNNNGDQTDEHSSKAVNAAGRRDPFISPVVAQAMVASGCSVGKKCLAVDQIVLKGVVKSDSGMIAVVVNAMDKAYFLRENDPIFNGYVVKITGDSVIFRETMHDKLGKTFTRDVAKKITTSAV
jgi:hypothetical protein